MKFSILLLSVILSVRALDVHVGFDDLSSPPGTYSINVNPTYGNPENPWVPTSFNYTIFNGVQDPSPTRWTYLINDASIATGTENFCNPTPMTPGGIAIQILRYGLDLNDKECPIARYTKGTNLPWTWAEAQSLDLEDIFNTAVKILTDGSLDSDVSVDAAADPSEPASGGMKRRRRDSSLVSVKLDIINDFVDTRFILCAKV